MEEVGFHVSSINEKKKNLSGFFLILKMIKILSLPLEEQHVHVDERPGRGSP